MTVVLRGMTWEHARGHGSVVAAAAAYRSVAPDVEVRWEYRSLQAFADLRLEGLVDDFDLLVIDHPHVPLAAESGLLAPLDGSGHDDELALLAQQSVGLSHESYRYGGHQYGLATDAAAQVAAYRPDLIDAPPADWAEVLDLARAGRVLWPAKPIDAFSSLVTVAANAGTPPFAEQGVFLAEADAAAAFALLHELAAHVPAEDLTRNPIQVADLLSVGDRFAYAPLLFGYTNYSRPGFRHHRLRYVDIPAGVQGVAGSLLGGAGIAVSARSRHLEEAIAHAFWLDRSDTQAGVYFDGGGQPGNAVAWDDDGTNAETLGFFRGTRATLEGAFRRPAVPEYMPLQDAAAPLVTRALAHEITVTEAIERINDLTGELMGAVDADR